MKDMILDYIKREYLDEEEADEIGLDENTPLISSGIVDSFSMVSLKRFLEKKYNVSIPDDQATPEAFFQRCQSLRPAFFAEIFARFTAGLLTATPARYAQELAAVQARFAAVVVVDGSRLAAIAHRLKLLWTERAVVLPGG